jgi:two-component system NarL family response regulator
MTDEIRVIIADDEETFRRLMADVLRTEPDITVVAEASDGEEAVILTGEHAPHVVLLDVRMPRLSGIDAARVLTEIHPSVRVLMLTISDEPEDVLRAIRNGASGYLIKDTGVEEIAQAIRCLQRGQAVLSRSIAPLLLAELTAWVREDDLPALRPRVTSRELQVLQYLAGGLEAGAVAREIGTTLSVIESHVHNVLVKLQIRERMRSVVTEILDDDEVIS